MENDVLELIEMLYTLVSEAWGVPLSNEKCIVERDKVLGFLDEIHVRLPKELSEAKQLLTARDEFISKAKNDADAIIKSAQDKAAALINEQQIVIEAKQKSSSIITEAETKKKEIYRVANEYVDDLLKRTEDAISTAMSEIQEQRQRFIASSSGRKPELK